MRPVLVWPVESPDICRMRTWRPCWRTKCGTCAAAIIWPRLSTCWWKPSSGFTRWSGGWERGWWRNASWPATKPFCNGSQPHVYAESILKTCEFCLESPLACVSGITGADLKKRVVRIMTEHMPNKLSFGRKLLLTTIGMAAIAGPVMFGIVNAPQILAQATTNTSGPLPAFEVASIRPNRSAGRGSSLRISRQQVHRNERHHQDVDCPCLRN